MRNRDVILGILVLALVGAGVYWARSRHAAPEGSAEQQVVAGAASPAGPGSPAGAAGAASATGAADARQPPAKRASTDETLPDVTRADASVDVGDVRLTLSIAPRPPVAFTKLRVRVRAEPARGSSAVPLADPRAPTAGALALEDARVSFEMTMPMGDHRYRLVTGGQGWHEAEVVLPFCASGNPRWYAIVQGTVGGRQVTARFRLDLTRPSSSSGRTGPDGPGQPSGVFESPRHPERGAPGEPSRGLASVRVTDRRPAGQTGRPTVPRRIVASRAPAGGERP